MTAKADMQRNAPGSTWSDLTGRLRGHSMTSSKGIDSESLLLIRAITEGTALLVGLLAIETLFLGRGAFAELGLHPFWLPVILVSLQHGLYGGVATATLAALFMDWSPRPPGVDISTYNLEMAHLPIQWLVSAVVIGLSRQNQRQQLAAQVKEIGQLRHRNQVLADEIRRIDEELWRFEVAAATASSAKPEAQHAPDAKSVERNACGLVSASRRSSDHHLVNAVVCSIAGLLSAVNARLFLRKESGDYLDVSKSNPPAGLAGLAGLAGVLTVDHPLVGRVVELDDPIYFDPADAAVGVIGAIAIRDQTTGVPLGLIAMRHSSSDNFSVDTLVAFSEATSAVLTRLSEFAPSEEAENSIGEST